VSRILLFGGSYNPIHFGHLQTARHAAKLNDFQEVIFVPCAPHKRSEYAPFEHRAQMVRRAIEPEWSYNIKRNGQLGFDICVEEGRACGTGKPSYTIDTVQLFRDAGFNEVFWLMGADNIERSKRWHRFNELRKICTFLVVPRPGYDIDPKSLLDHNAIVTETLPCDISSTDIRLKIKLGQDISHLTPVSVAEYISEHNLYAPQPISVSCR
jgi:nicotinate-nucleotide adenylyltransferase